MAIFLVGMTASKAAYQVYVIICRHAVWRVRRHADMHKIPVDVMLTS